MQGLKAEQRAEIEATRDQTEKTRRATVPALEEILYEPLPALDHGFVRVIDYMGDDAAIVQAARVSYGKGTKAVSSDAGLINYLVRHRHTSPLEMCEIKLHCKMPIFVARQWIRHRTAATNEYSARYSILSNQSYLPERRHLAAQSASNRQGREDGAVGDEEAENALWRIKEHGLASYALYQRLLNEEPHREDHDGLARELARMVLPPNFYTEWYWKIDLHNLLHFLSLRADSHAQYEIRAYAEVMLDIVKRWVPLTHAAFIEHRMEAATLSKSALDLLRASLLPGDIDDMVKPEGMSEREFREVTALLRPKSGS